MNLGVGAYHDESGRLAIMDSVRQAEQRRMNAASARGYLPIDGLASYDRAVRELVFGKGSDLLAENRVVTVQTLGGTGGLKVGADFLKRVVPSAQVWISDPSWENHGALFDAAGFGVKNYPYYDPKTHGLDFLGMTEVLRRAAPGDIVVLHACCHICIAAINTNNVDYLARAIAQVLDS